MNDNERHKIIEDFYKELFENQEDCPQEFVDIFNDNFWDLI
jgi:hypothetical protein